MIAQCNGELPSRVSSHAQAHNAWVEVTTWESRKMSTAGQLLVGGERTTGESIRSQNGVCYFAFEALLYNPVVL